VLVIKASKETVPVLHSLESDKGKTKVLSTTKSLNSWLILGLLARRHSEAHDGTSESPLLIHILAAAAPSRSLPCWREAFPRRSTSCTWDWPHRLVPRRCYASWVRVHAMGASRVRSAGFKLLQLVRRIRPDVILSGMFT